MEPRATEKSNAEMPAEQEESHVAKGVGDERRAAAEQGGVKAHQAQAQIETQTQTQLPGNAEPTITTANKQASAVHMVHLSKPRRWAALFVLLLGMLVLSLDMTIMDIALPSIAKELHPTADQQLWMVDVYSLALAGLLVSCSSISDRIGRKKMFVLGSLAFCVVSALVLFADSSNKVIAVRALMGISAAMIMPTTMSMIRNIFANPKERAAAISAWAIVSAIGGAGGPILGGVLLEFTSWHSAFLVNVPLMGVAFAAGLFLLPEITVAKKGPWDLVAAGLSLGGMILIMWGIKRLAATLDATNPTILGALVAGFVLMALFVVRCLRAKEPLLDVRLFANKAFTGGITTAFGALFASAAIFFLVSQWLQLVSGYSPLEAGLRMLPVAITSALSGAAAPMLALRIGARPVMVAGIVIAALSAFVLALGGTDLTYGYVAASMALSGLSMGAFSVGSSVIMCSTPPESSASGAAFEEIAYDVGNVLGVALLGSVASIIYRSGFSIEQLSNLGLSEAQIADALGSYGGAIAIAQETGVNELVTQGAFSFNESLMFSALVGGVLLVIFALVVARLIPKGFSIAEEE